MRLYLTDYCRDSSMADIGEDEECVQGAPQPGKPRLSVRAFIQRTSKNNIAELIAFPLHTWAVLFFSFLILASSMQW